MVEPAQKNVGQNVEARHEVELLEDHGAVAMPTAQRGPAKRRNLDAVETDRPFARVDEPVDHAQKRGFASARAPDDADHLAVAYLQIDAVDGGVFTKPARYVADFQHDRLSR